MKTHMKSKDIQKENIRLIEKRDIYRVETHIEKDTQNKDTQRVEIYTENKNTYKKGHIRKEHREEYNG